MPYFYPRSPRGERPYIRRHEAAPATFLSTLPARGATSLTLLPIGKQMISIHAPREGSDMQAPDLRKELEISIHAPREGSDYNVLWPILINNISIHAPREGSDCHRSTYLEAPPISIHAPREGSDDPQSRKGTRGLYFYPRSPRGERPTVWEG